VSIDTLLRDVDTDARFVLAHSHGGYSSNLPIEDVTEGKGVDRVRLRTASRSSLSMAACAAPRAPSLLLEERQVGERPRVARHGQPGLLGDVWLPQLP
jgi:hypothetical protein